ncbi:OmpH family outer membrane protein [Magnetovibrio blakemorei]|uniref:OmpH family outer membrane protein n=1 Tax=Magnetovibrio blakemorei TaxID=28181 RepID=UPI00147A3592|nr:OmpH family outer membrane protein [Magnetovibrio blakemorei]
MNIKSFAGMCCAIVLGALSIIPQANAQDAAANKAASAGVYLAVLDTDAVFVNAKAMQTIHEQMAKFQADLQTTIDKEKADVKKAEEELLAQRPLLAADVFAEKRKQFQERIVKLQREVQESNLKLNTVRTDANKKVTDVFRAVVADIVKINGITVVFQKGQVVFSDPKLDITNLVLIDLDKRLPSVKVASPKK